MTLGKYFISTLLIAGLLTGLACNDFDDEPEALPQTWQLFEIHAYMTDTTTDAEEEGIMETLMFNADSTFVLMRTTPEETTESTGTFVVDTLNGVPAFSVTFGTGGAFNCGLGATHTYTYQGTTLLDQNGIPCDGPEYRYYRVD